MMVPSGVPPFTLKVNEKTAIALAGSVVIEQVIGPVPPGGVKAGPEFCAAVTKAVLAGIESERVTP
jgi:hypothetical protein